MSLTDAGIRKAVAVLIEANFKPPADLDALLRSWLDRISDVEDDELLKAAGDWCAGNNSFFPRPGQLRHLATERRASYDSRFWEEPEIENAAPRDFDLKALWRKHGVDV